MYRLLLVGDPHLKKYQQHEYRPMVEQLIEQVKRISPDAVAFMGDLLDAHDNIDLVAQCDALKMIFEVSQTLKIKTIVLVGNHDRINNSDFLSHYSSLYGLTHTPNVFLIDQPTIIQLTVDIHIGVVPYLPTGRFKEALTNDLENWQRVRLLLTHQEWRGSIYNGQQSETGDEGDEWINDQQQLIPIYNGHIHDYGRPRKHIVNIGTPRQIAFGENEDKALMLLSISSNMKLSVIEERIPLKLPKRRIIKLEVEEAEKWQPDKEHFYKLEVSGTAAQIETFVKSEYWRNLKTKGVKLKRTYQREVVPTRVYIDRRTYRTRLEEFIEYDPLQLSLYHKYIKHNPSVQS